MSEYAQAKRSSGSETASGPAHRSGGGPGGALSDTLNASPAVQQTAQLKSALNSGPPVAQMMFKRAATKAGDFMKNHIYGKHNYEVRNKTFPPDLPDFEKFEALKKYPAPGARNSPEGEGADKFMALGPIHTIANKEDLSVTNSTRPGHLLHNYLGGEKGVVKRTVEGEDIVTKGEGYGMFPSLNNVLAPYVWGPEAYKARLETDPKEQAFQENLNRQMMDNPFE